MITSHVKEPLAFVWVKSGATWCIRSVCISSFNPWSQVVSICTSVLTAWSLCASYSTSLKIPRWWWWCMGYLCYMALLSLHTINLLLHLIISTNFSLVTVDTSCSDLAFEKIGCFKDNHIVSARPLPEYLSNDRDPKIATFSGQRIDWRNWDIYVKDFACRCAKAANERNYTIFGMQFYGKKEVFSFFISELLTN